jgi:mucin-2
MHRSILALAASTALIVSGPAYAQHGQGGGKPTTSPAGSHAPSTTHGNSGTTTHGNSGATTHGQSGSHGTTTKPNSGSTHGSGNTHASGAGNNHTTSGTTTTTPTATSPTSTGTGTTTTLTPVQQKLQKNTNLADKLRGRLPANTDLMLAADGFSNLGQFVAAVNVSNNLGLKFTELKTRMVDDGMSLGQAIQDVKKIPNVETEVRRAETEADSMIKSSTTTTATTSTSSTSTVSSTTKKTKRTKPSTGDK